MASSRPVITLTTDFGLSDHYAGTMKCVISGICPEAQIIDITHEIAPSDRLSAAYAISQAAPFSPLGSIHVVVVDPGVGTARRAIAMRNDRNTFIAPDNGVLSLVMPADDNEIDKNDLVRELTNPRISLPSQSATFQGRDLFAPAAAHLAAGNIGWEALGPQLKTCVRLPNFKPIVEFSGRWSGMVLSVDHFGNVITNFPISLVAIDSKAFTLEANAYIVQRFCRTFAESTTGEPFVYAGSSGYFEIAINQGNAASAIGVSEGDPIVLEVRA
ncbi:MAG: SAM-dependent chlorinase/fluorinase [Bryobacteraceae bacterium]